MSENQESDTDTNNNFNTIEGKVNYAKEQQELAETEYNETHDKINNLKDMLNYYLGEKQTIICKYDAIIAISLIVAMVLSIGLASFLLGNLAVSLFKFSFWLGGIAAILSIPAIGVVIKKLTTKLQEIIENKIPKQITKSEEYQKVLIQIETIEEDLKQAQSLELEKKINLRNATAYYGAMLSEQKLKQSKLDQTNYDFTPKKEIKTTKQYARRRTNNRKRNMH